MVYTSKVMKILNNYENTNAGIKANLGRILTHGSLGGTGRLLILPVDQGHEHGPDKSFFVNPEAYDPDYHYQLAIEAKLSAYAAPYGFLESGAERFAGQIPTILKMNSSNGLNDQKYQSVNGSVKDALRLGCSAVGFTIYPGSEYQYDMIEEFKEISQEASEFGLPSVLWSYPRGGKISKEGETSLDIIGYAAHIAAQLGAHIIKVKPPSTNVENKDIKNIFNNKKIDFNLLSSRISHIKKCAFNNKRIVVFSGGNSKNTNDLLDEIKQIKLGGGNGSIIGRNTFQRPREEALNLLREIISIYKS
ncbi:MAG: Fructose-bisphosphate aldolase class 1 [Alphaproteobacteria bacterium MarineAlpha9_Bin4]|nr:fructose-bisphosphate aldolase [Pelagibacterales bacterium]PPR25759.1 MAG: Fructose-bisphosphate aldolase class 1 [Alphaproteobacteria bacterium MarineAlpha9_Bin4]|tara:strand:+ start:751 stop:1665 length:915 start_codon:yes stop_codon:yes gene_type:complete